MLEDRLHAPKAAASQHRGLLPSGVGQGSVEFRIRKIRAASANRRRMLCGHHKSRDQHEREYNYPREAAGTSHHKHILPIIRFLKARKVTFSALFPVAPGRPAAVFLRVPKPKIADSA